MNVNANAVRPHKGKRLPRAVREQQMLDAAVRIFGRRGYRAASMDEIAEVAGVSKPLVYLYLHSKEELFTTCIRREARALVAAVRGGVTEDAAADRQLWDGLRAFFTHTSEHPDGWAVLHNQARTHGEPFAREVKSMRDELLAFVTHLIGTAAREAQCDPLPAENEVAGLAHALVGAAESLAGWAGGNADARGDARAGTRGDTRGEVQGQGKQAARDTAALLMNFAWTGLENLMNGRRWGVPAR